jgi:hypothetical protein
MPYLITTSLYPSEKAPEVGARYLEALAKYPPDESLSTQVVPAAVTTTHQGIKVTGISDVKEGKLEEALRRAGDFMVMFHNIAGFEYTVEVNSKVEEAMSAIGMDMP